MVCDTARGVRSCGRLAWWEAERVSSGFLDEHSNVRRGVQELPFPHKWNRVAPRAGEANCARLDMGKDMGGNERAEMSELG